MFAFTCDFFTSNLDYPMRRSRKREAHWIELIALLAGLFILGWTVSPQFRALVLWTAIVVVCVGVIALVVRIKMKAKHRSVSTQPNASLRVAHPWLTQAQPAAVTSEPIHFTPEPWAWRAPPASVTPEPIGFTPELLSALEWRRLEMLVTLYFQKTGYVARRNRVGADGGVDIIISHPGESQPAAFVQCKAWRVYTVGVKPVRELLGVMAAEKVGHGFFVTTGDFTAEAVQFARGQSLVLVSGSDLLKDLNQLPEAARREILAEITAGDYTTPTCPRCDVKMVERQGPRGTFWGCRNYPRCRQTFKMEND